jgi:hypothetical protein
MIGEDEGYIVVVLGLDPAVKPRDDVIKDL